MSNQLHYASGHTNTSGVDLSAGKTHRAADIRLLVGESPMSPHQLFAVLVCVGLNMLDGFDILVMSFTAPGVSAEWQLSGSQLGLLFSAGLVGVACGSLFLAPRADRAGRRVVVLASVAIVTVGMLSSGFAHSYALLIALRAATGLGIGGILASATVLVAEYASNRWRNTASFLYTSGYSLGATIGGALAKLNRLLSKMNLANVAALPLPEAPGATPKSASLRRLVTASLSRPTFLIWTAFFFMMGGYYCVFSWTPKLLTASGLTAEQSISSGVLLSLGGIGGTVLFALIAGVALGGVSTSAMAGLYALTPTLYEADLRSSGMGWGLGIGRIGAIVAPSATGVLVDHHWHPTELFCVFAGTFILAALALSGMTPAMAGKFAR